MRSGLSGISSPGTVRSPSIYRNVKWHLTIMASRGISSLFLLQCLNVLFSLHFRIPSITKSRRPAPICSPWLSEHSARLSNCKSDHMQSCPALVAEVQDVQMAWRRTGIASFSPRRHLLENQSLLELFLSIVPQL